MSAQGGAGDRLYSISRRERVDRVMTSITVNEVKHRIAVRPHDVLLDVLREQLNLTGSRRGCDMGTCGCCTVILDGRPVLSCLTLALEAEGLQVTTIEGIAHGEESGGLHPVQQAFVDQGASQCGFCTPGFIMTAVSLLSKTANPSESEIREAISGNMCRCTGYLSIIAAIQQAASVLRQRASSSTGSAPAGTPR